MTLSVGSISNRYSAVSYANNAKNLANNKNSVNLNSQPSFEGETGKKVRNGLASAAMVSFFLVPILSSCDKDWFNHAEAYAEAHADCHCIPVDRDTVWVKDDFKSPVIDTINVILDDLGVDRGGKYIPLKISFVDELNANYKKYLFAGEESSPSQIVYKGTVSPFDDVTGQFIIGTPLDERERYLASLTGDGKLYLMKMIPKNGVTEPKGLDDYVYASESLVLDRNAAKKLISRFSVPYNSIERKFVGTMQKGELPRTVLLTNPYDATWRYTNIDVVSEDAPSSDGYNENYIRKY